MMEILINDQFHLQKQYACRRKQKISPDRFTNRADTNGNYIN